MRPGIPDEVITGTHAVRVQVQALRGGDVLDDDVPVFSGVIDWVYDNNVPALVDLRVPLDYVPRTPFDALAPFGQRLVVSQTLTVGPDEHTVNLGQFLITEVRQDAEQTNVRAQGLEYLLLDARLTSAVTPAGTYADTLTDLCRGILPVDVQTHITDRSLAASVTQDWADDNERMNIVRDLERKWPATFVVDEDGVLVAYPEKTVQTEPVVQWAHGQDNAYVTLSSGSLREDVYNAYVQRGETGDGVPVQATAFDNNPQSPTYYLGPFGQRPRFAFSPQITTKQQATAAAKDGLRRELIRTAKVVVDAPPDPRVELYDTARVTAQDGTVAHGMVIEMGLPLTPGDGVARYVIGEVAL